MVKGIKKFFQKLKSLKEPFHPHQTFMVLWNMIASILVIYEVILHPLTISFDLDIPESLNIFEGFIDSFFIMDLILKFHVAYILKGNPITNHKSIAINYLSDTFAFDLIAAFPYNYIINTKNTSFLGLFRVFRLYKIKTIINVIEKLYLLSNMV